jgi:hypothetical protein
MIDVGPKGVKVAGMGMGVHIGFDRGSMEIVISILWHTIQLLLVFCLFLIIIKTYIYSLVFAIRQVLNPSFRKSRSSPPKNKPFSQEIYAFKDNAFKPGFEIVKF